MNREMTSNFEIQEAFLDRLGSSLNVRPIRIKNLGNVVQTNQQPRARSGPPASIFFWNSLCMCSALTPSVIYQDKSRYLSASSTKVVVGSVADLRHQRSEVRVICQRGNVSRFMQSGSTSTRPPQLESDLPLTWTSPRLGGRVAPRFALVTKQLFLMAYLGLAQPL
jgi:hypothetical protein